MRYVTPLLLTLFFGLGLVSLLGCATERPEFDTAADVQAINDLREREGSAFFGGDVDGLVSLFTSDAVIMPPDAPAVFGEAAIRTWAQSLADQFTISGEYTGSEIDVIGDWAVERYTANLGIAVAGDDPVPESMKGIHIYRRQADGSWLITQDVWNADEPAPSDM